MLKHLVASTLCLAFATLLAAQEAKPASRPAKDQIRAKVDKNHDGEIDERERMMAHEHMMKMRWEHFAKEHPRVAAEMKAKADADGDGKVSEDEWKAARKAMHAREQQRREAWVKNHPEAAERMKDKADRNDDGKVGPAERARMRQVTDEKRSKKQ